MIKIARAGKVIGEYNRGDVPALVQSKTVLASDDYWTSGMAAWAKVSSLLSEIEACAPPPPTAPSPTTNLTKCPDCQKEVSKLAQSCPGCGRPLLESPKAAPEGPKRVITTEDSVMTRSRGCGDIIVFSPIILILLAVMVAMMGSCSRR